MRTARLCVVALVGVVLLGSSVLAQEAVSVKAKHEVRPARREHLKGLYDKLVKELDLTAEQQTQVKQIIETHRQAVENWRKENIEDIKVLREQIAKARKEKDTEALKELHKKVAKIWKQRRELQEAMHKQIAAVLTDQQKEKFGKMMHKHRRAVIGMHVIHMAMRGLDLSEKQEKQIRKIVADTKAVVAEAKTPKEKAELWRKAIETIKTKVLTDKQRKKFEQTLHRLKHHWRIRKGLAALNLTDAQKEQIKKIKDGYREKIKNAKGKDRRELMKKMRDEMNSVLTDEQKTQLKKQREKFREHHPALNLTDAQKEQIKKIKDKYREKIKNAEGKDRRELMKKMRDEINSVLTDEQKAKLKKHREEQKKKWQEHRKRHKGRPHGPPTDDE